MIEITAPFTSRYEARFIVSRAGFQRRKNPFAESTIASQPSKRNRSSRPRQCAFSSSRLRFSSGRSR